MSKKNRVDPSSPFAALQTMKTQMETAEAERQKKELEAREAARERGELEGRRKGAPAKPASAPTRASREAPRPEFDAHLFAVAMSGVVPLGDKAPRVNNAPEVTPRRKAPLETKLKQQHAEGGETLTVRWEPDGTVQGFRRGHEFALEAIARFALPDDTLDLHGCEVHEAAIRVAEFVRTRRARRMRCVRVIHGWGKGSPDGATVLADATVRALQQPPACNEVNAFVTAPDAHGGRGALLIALR